MTGDEQYDDDLATDDDAPPGIELVAPSRRPDKPPKDEGNADAELKEADDE